jgi:hypothetical protein
MFHHSVPALRYLLWVLIASAVGIPLLMLIVHDPLNRLYVILISIWFFLGLFLLIIRITHRVTAKRTLDELEARRAKRRTTENRHAAPDDQVPPASPQ